MAAKKKAEKPAKVTKVLETEQIIVFRPNRPLSKTQFELLSDLIRSEEQKSGVKIVLAPYSCDVSADDR